jgi:hypothetical protein
MLRRLSALSIEELAGVAFLALAVLALALNAGVLTGTALHRAGTPVGAIRDAEDQRMRVVLAQRDRTTAGRPAPRVVIVGEPCVTVGVADDGQPIVSCARQNWPLHPR